MRQAKAFLVVCAGLFLLALSYHLGARSAGAQSPVPEVACRSGVISNGQQIPLPVYADGTEALESECSWIVSPNRFLCDAYNSAWVTCYTSNGRWVTCTWQIYTLPVSPPPNDLQANYLIVARRGSSAPTPAQSISIGQLKAKYATPAGK